MRIYHIKKLPQIAQICTDKIKVGICFFVCCFSLISCNQDLTENDKKSNENTTKEIDETKPAFFKFSAPLNNEKYRTGDKIPLSVSITNDKIKIDSIVFSFNGKRIGNAKQAPYEITWSAINAPTGNQKITATIYFDKTQKETIDSTVLFLSDLKPKEYSYKIIKTYNHDPEAYTQGLFIDKGVMYESTGGNGTSSIRKVKYETGEILKSVSIDNEIFGEGITTYGNKIYQITWKSNVCFVYEKETFKQINIFNYSTEGWGITTDGKQLIMSDGSARLYFMNPENFSQISSLEVWDFEEEVLYLNELEYIKDEIWANVYQEDYIVRIDPKTGKVLGKIDLKGILDMKTVSNKIDVLNGIAYDAAKNKIYVTGKWWPKMFEIELVEKK